MPQIRIQASANMKSVEAQFATLTAQVKAMNAELAKSALIPQGGNPAGFARVSRAANEATRAYNAALASSGQFRVEQLKINDAVSKQSELLQRQKLNFNETFGKKSRTMMRAVYREQLALQQVVARTQEGLVGDGKTRMSMGVPTEVHKSWDTLNNQIGFFRTRLASASAELVNWGKNTQWAGRQLMAGISMPVAAFGAAAGVMAYQVDKQLTRIAKVYDTTANQNSMNIKEMQKVEAELAKLREDGMNTAVNAAKAYGSAVTETLEVQAELAATGQKGLRLQESTNEVMRISALGEIEHAEATKALISLQSVLGLSARETGDAFNYMNSIENATSLSTQDFVEAIPRALGPMKEMGGTLQDLAVLMVAMKERGIDAGEGANAIKAMMQRLYRPSRQVREEWQQIANVDPMKFVEESGGNVMEMLPRIAEATKDLNRADRVKLLAGLFGTYQVTRMSAMLKGLEDMNKGIGQTTRVLEVNQQTTKEWGETAQQEIDKQAESASGRFKRAYEGIRAELARLGEPFLEVASRFIELSSSILGFINGLPEWAKKGIVFAAMLAAIVGPVVMLIGLFANFAGNIGRFGATLLGTITSFEFLNKSQVAARLSAQLAETEFMKEASAAQILRTQLDALTKAHMASALAMSQHANVPLPPEIMQSLGMNKVEPTGRNGMPPVGGLSSSNLTSAERRAQIQRQINAGQIQNNKLSAAELSIKEKTRVSVTGTGVAMAGLGASTLMVTGLFGQGAQELGKWLMIGSVVAPAVSGMVPVVQAINERAKKAGASFMATARGATAGTTATKGMAAAAKGVGAGLMAAMGPIGWVTAGLTAATAIFFAWKNHQDEIAAKQKKIHKEEMRANKALMNTSASIATNLGKAAGAYKQIADVNGSGGEVFQNQLMTSYNYYKENDDGKAQIRAFQTDNGELIKTEQMMEKLRTKFIDLQVLGNNTARQSQIEIQSILLAAGASASEASSLAAQIFDEYGSISQIDWAKPIEDQTNALSRMAKEAFKLNRVETGGRGGVAFLYEFEVDDQARDKLYQQGKKAAQIFNEALANAASPQEARKLINQYMEAATEQWDVGFNSIMSTDNSISGAEEVKALFAKYGIDSGKAFADAMREDGEFEDAYLALTNGSSRVNREFAGQLDFYRKFAQEYEHSFINPLAEGSHYLSDNVLTAATAFKEFNQAGIGLTADGAIKALQEENQAFKDYEAALTRVNNLRDWGIPENSIAMIEAQNDLNSKTAALIPIVNSLNKTYGFKEGRTASEALANFLNKVKVEADEATAAGRRMNNAFSMIINEIDIAGIRKAGMSAVVNDLSDVISEDFDKRMSSSLESNTNYWDSAIERMQNAQQAASDRLDKKQENQSERFDMRWERRKDAVEKAYDSRIDKINKTIEAEQKAEEIRERIFEAERTRLERLTETANRTIDFNVALQTGELDEAAKISNDMNAAAQEWALADASNDGRSASERRQDALSNRADALGDQKDKALKALDAREKAERKSLERRQEAERKHLEKVQKMNLDSLNAQADASKKAFQAEWDARKKSLNGQLETFKSFIPKNQRQLKQWMDRMGIDYETFGLEILKPKSDKWGKWYQDSLSNGIRRAGTEIASDNMWKRLGTASASKTLAGMGFTMSSFKRFVTTGKLPKEFGKPLPDDKPGKRTPLSPDNQAVYRVQARHEGGFVSGGFGGGSRKGVARTLKKNHPSEVMVRAKEGEFVVNHRAAKKHGGILNAINDGVYDPSFSTMGNLGGAAPGFAGLVSGIIGRMFSAGISKSLSNTYSNVSAMSGAFGTAKAGKYGDSAFTAEQLNNAKIIADVGRQLGASSRDIVIALATAMQESTLRNLSWGDRDSVGLFQQRNAWGSFEARTNPATAARMFFTGGMQGQKGLFDIENRNSMSLAEAAQAVQVSAYPDAYAKWADEAQAIFNALSSSGTSGGFVMGNGKRRPPVDRPWSSSYNIHGSPPAVDLAVPVGRNVYAPADGVVIESRDLKGFEPRAPHGGLGYRSYGRYVTIRHDNGASTLSAHLSQRYVREGQRVAGGSIIGKSGDTGYSFGPHVHFAATNGPLAWLEKGGHTLGSGLAMLHDEETVLTKPLSKELQYAVKAFGQAGRDKLANNFHWDNILSGSNSGYSTREISKAAGNIANSGETQYNLKVFINEPGASSDEITQKVMNALKKKEDRKPKRRK